MTMRIFPSTVLLCSLAMAQDTPPVPSPAERVVSGAFGIDFTNQYFFRGIQQENQGVIGQPWWQLGYGLYEGDGSLRKLDLTFGMWNSLHDGPTGTEGNFGMWYESDFHIGVAGVVGERLHVGTRYATYHSPNGGLAPNQAVGTVEELVFSVKYDDRGQLVESVVSGLQPRVELAIELDGQRDAGTHVGIYAGIGIAPSIVVGKLGEDDITLSLPATLGLSLRDYYEVAGDDDFFGFLEVGAVASAPLSFLPSRMGPWQAHVGLHFMLLGDNNEQRNQGDTSELVFSCGMSTTF